MPQRRTPPNSIHHQHSYYLIALVNASMTAALFYFLYQSGESTITPISQDVAKDNILTTNTVSLALLQEQNAELSIKQLDLFDKVLNATAISLCSEKLKILKEQSPFRKWVENYRVKLDPRLIDEEHHLETARQLCKQAFMEILAEDSIFPNLLLNDNLEIILAPYYVLFGPASTGVYAPDTNMIGVIYKRDATIDTYKQALRNEYFAHQVMARNIKVGITTSFYRFSLLFLKLNGDINEKAVVKFEEAIQKDKEIIATYKKMLRKKNVAPNTQQKLNPLLNSANHYSPKVFVISENEFNMGIELNIITSPDENGYFTSGQNHPTHLPHFHGKKQGSVISYRYCEDDAPISKAKGLIADFIMQLDALKSKQGPYAAMPTARKLTELGSFIAEFP